MQHSSMLYIGGFCKGFRKLHRFLLRKSVASKQCVFFKAKRHTDTMSNAQEKHESDLIFSMSYAHAQM